MILWVSWTSRSLFSDSILGERTRRSEDKEIDMLGIRRSCTKLCLMPSKLIKKLPYVLFIGKKWAETIRQWDKVSGKLIEQCFTRGTQAISITLHMKHTVALGWIPQPYSGRKVGFPEPEPAHTYPRPWLQDFTGSAKLMSSLRGQFVFLWHILAGTLDQPSPQH